MNQPAISVIVPFYNAAATLGATLTSLAASSCRDIEVLLIDDASTDATPDLARAQVSQDARFRFLHNPTNRGVSFSRNRGLDEACGQWVAFVDADDWISSDWLANLLADAATSRAEVVIDRTRRIRDGREEDYPMQGLRHRGALAFADIVFKDNSVVWNKLYAAALIRRDRLRFDDSLWIGEDLLFNFSALHAAQGLFYGAQGHYHHRADNETSIMRSSSAPDRVANFSRLLHLLKVAAESVGLPRHPALRKVARDLLMDHYRYHTPPPDDTTLGLIRQISPTLPLRVRASVWRKSLRARF